MSYWDTSTLVKLYAQEPDSSAFENHAFDSPTPLVTSRIALYEARATFQRKETEGALQVGTAETTYQELEQDVLAGEVRLIELSADVEREYGQALKLPTDAACAAPHA